MNNRIYLKKLVFSALLLAIAYILPYFTGSVPRIGNMLCPMHFPVILCGFICGWKWGAVVGFTSPLLRSLIVGMPALFPAAISMAFELMVYGAASGLLYKLLPKKPYNIYISLISAMIAGRVVWGISRYVCAGASGTEFPFSLFIAGAITNALPGIILQIVLIPIIVIALKKSKLLLQ